MKLRTIVILAMLAALRCAGCGSVFNGAIDDMTLRQKCWYTFLGGGGSDTAYSIQQTSDGGYIIAGYATATILPDKMQNAPCLNSYSGGDDMLIVKLDAGGNVAWYTFLGGTMSDRARSIQPTSDGGYIVAGYARGDIPTLQGKSPLNGFAGGYYDMLIVKLDAGGNVVWYTFLGGGGADQARSIQPTADGGYVVAGESTATALPQGTRLNPNSGGSDMLIVKLDAGGNVVWYTFLGGTGDDTAYSIRQTSDGGYIISGSATETIPSLQGKTPINPHSSSGTYRDILVVKLDAGGNAAWYTFLGGASTDYGYSIQQTSDGGYVVAGIACATIDPGGMQNAPCFNPYSGGSDMLIVKLDTGGNVAWYAFLGGTGDDNALSIRQTSDGGYIVAGNAGADISTLYGEGPINPYSTGTDMLIIKLKNDGTL